MRVLLNILFVLCSLSLLAQAQDSTQFYDGKKIEMEDGRKLNARKTKKVAAYSQKAGDPYTAIDYYEDYMEKKPADIKTLNKLGLLYLAVRNHQKALITFNKVYLKDSLKFPMSQYYYAKMLMAKGDHSVALPILTRFKKKYEGKDAKIVKKKVKLDIASCEFATRNKDEKGDVNTFHLDTVINNPYTDFSPIIVNDSTILYSSLKPSGLLQIGDRLSIQVLPGTNIYEAKKTGKNEWTNVGVFDPVAKQAEEGEKEAANGCFNLDSTRFYFNLCAPNARNEMICHIYYSDKNAEDGWGKPVALDELINMPNYTSTQPTIGIESKKNREVLYFASNRIEGGRGGMDIWYTIYTKKRDKFSTPRNAGKGINTPYDDMTPRYDVTNQTMYFSSEGWPGYGGLDIFKVQGQVKKWAAVENLLPPFNSHLDDLYYTEFPDQKNGFFVSNRAGSIALKHDGCCDDIFSFERLKIIRIGVKGKAIDADTEKAIKNGTAGLYFIDSLTKEEILLTHQALDADGAYFFNLAPNKDYKVVIMQDKYLNNAHEISTRDVSESDTISLSALALQKPTKPINLAAITYGYNSSDLSDDVKMSIDTGLYILIRENANIKVEISSHTDNVGSDEYNKNLSQKRAETVVNYLVEKGISKDRVTAKGYGETSPIATNETEEGRAQNRRTEFRVIGKVNIRSLSDVKKKKKKKDEEEDE